MNTDQPSPSPTNQDAVSVTTLAELQALGRLLDSMERGAAPMSARQFRRAALRASDILGSASDLTPLRRTCASLAPLRELLQNELMARAVMEGTVRWAHSGKF